MANKKIDRRKYMWLHVPIEKKIQGRLKLFARLVGSSIEKEIALAIVSRINSVMSASGVEIAEQIKMELMDGIDAHKNRTQSNAVRILEGGDVHEGSGDDASPIDG